MEVWHSGGAKPFRGNTSVIWGSQCRQNLTRSSDVASTAVFGTQCEHIRKGITTLRVPFVSESTSKSFPQQLQPNLSVSSHIKFAFLFLCALRKWDNVGTIVFLWWILEKLSKKIHTNCVMSKENPVKLGSRHQILLYLPKNKKES